MKNSTYEMNSIYIWRIIFTLVIIMFHLNFEMFWRANLQVDGVLGWYIPVEFFFIVSGFLLARTADLNEGMTAFEYIKRRIRRIYPSYLASFILAMAVTVVFTDWMHHPIKVYELFAEHFFEAIMLHGIGLNRLGDDLNFPTWYISIMMIASYFLFLFISKKKDLLLSLVAPIVIIVNYSYLYRTVGHLDVSTEVTAGFYLNGALFRGLADMCLGIYSYEIYKKLFVYCNGSSILRKRSFYRAMGNFSFAFVTLATLKYGLKHADYFYLIIFLFGVAFAFLPYEKPHNQKCDSIIMRISDLTLNAYLVHDIYRKWLLPKIFPQSAFYSADKKIMIIILFISIVFLTALAMDYMLKGMIYLFDRNGKN